MAEIPRKLKLSAAWAGGVVATYFFVIAPLLAFLFGLPFGTATMNENTRVIFEAFVGPTNWLVKHSGIYYRFLEAADYFT